MAGKAKNTAKVDDSRFTRRVLIVLALASLFYIVWQLRHLALMLFGAVVIATIFRALADRFAKLTGCREGLAVAASIFVVLGSLVGLGILFGSQVSQQIGTLRETLPDAWRSFEERLHDVGLGEQLQRMLEGMRQSGGSLSGISSAIMQVGNGIAEVLVVLFGGIFLAAQPRFYKTGAIKLIPPSRRPVVAEAMDESERALRLWLKGQLIAMIAVGTLTGVGLWLLGMPSALVLGLLAGILEFIPFAGPIIASIPAILLALAVSPDMALWVVLLYVIVQQLEGNLLQPMIQQYAVDLPGVILLFSLIAFGMLFGTLGVILAAPLSVVSYVLVKRLYVRETLGTKTPIPGEDQD